MIGLFFDHLSARIVQYLDPRDYKYLKKLLGFEEHNYSGDPNTRILEVQQNTLSKFRSSKYWTVLSVIQGIGQFIMLDQLAIKKQPDNSGYQDHRLVRYSNGSK